MADAAGRRPVSDPRDIPLLVLSFDGYADLWPPFFHFFWRNWPDCPFSVHLGTNFRTWDGPGVTTLHSGTEHSWATRVTRLLELLDSEYVLLFLEDFLLEAPVDTREVLRLGEVTIQNRVGCLRLAPKPAPSRPVYGQPDLGWILPGDPYRLSSQVSFWHTDTLRQLLEHGQSIWDFEYTGSLSGPVPMRPMWARWEAAIHYQHCVERGMWLPWGIRTCREAGVPVDLTVRPAMLGLSLWQRYYGAFRGFAFRRLPASVQRKRWVRIAEREGKLRTRLTIPAGTGDA
jgi:hypothetical protein